MRKLILASAIALAGCATNGSSTLTQEQATQIAQQVEQYTSRLCNFQPTAAAVLQLIGAFYAPGQPLVMVANAIGAALCSSPTTAAVSKGRRYGVVHLVTTPDGQQIAVHDRRDLLSYRRR